MGDETVGEGQETIVKLESGLGQRHALWCGDSHYIDVADIVYISWGFWTPRFQKREDLEEDRCFSVIGENHVLDLYAPNAAMAGLWVRELRKLMQTKWNAPALSHCSSCHTSSVV